LSSEDVEVRRLEREFRWEGKVSGVRAGLRARA